MQTIPKHLPSFPTSWKIAERIRHRAEKNEINMARSDMKAEENFVADNLVKGRNVELSPFENEIVKGKKVVGDEKARLRKNEPEQSPYMRYTRRSFQRCRTVQKGDVFNCEMSPSRYLSSWTKAYLSVVSGDIRQRPGSEHDKYRQIANRLRRMYAKVPLVSTNRRWF